MKRESSSEREDSDAKLHCLKCSKTFSTQRYLNQHMQVHGVKYKCDQCEKEFTFSSNLATHKKCAHGDRSNKKFTCDICNKSFGKKYHLVRHRKCVHHVSSSREVDVSFPCRHCDMVFHRYRDLVDHVEASYPINQQGGQENKPTSSKKLKTDSESDVHENNIVAGSSSNERDDQNHEEDVRNHSEESALNNTVQNRYISPRQNERFDVLTFFANIREEVMAFLRSRMQSVGGIKWNLCVQVELQRDDGSETRISSPFFRSRTYVTLTIDDMNEHDLNEALQKMFASLEKYMREGSGWFVKEVLKLEIHTVTYRPISGSSLIPLPLTLLRSNCIINIRNGDDKCFLYCVLASLHPVYQQREEVDQYAQYEHELNMTGIQYPVTLSDIRKFEKQNDNISINVFTFENECILPLRVSENKNRLHHVDLLWLKTTNKSHYCLITNLNRFLSRTKRCKNQQYFCPYCLHAFSRVELLTEHQPNCSVHGPQKVELPSEKEAILKFTDYEKTLKVPFVIYADFETVNKKIHTCVPNPEHSATTPTTKLEVCGFGYKVVCEDGRYTKPTVVYRGPDAAKHLIDRLLKEQEEISRILSVIKPAILRPELIGLIENATHCCLCKKEFTQDDEFDFFNRTVIHHNHLTGEVIGASCNSCNLQCRQAKFTCVIFHNLKNFDAHILCETLGQFKEHKLTCIAQNSERYVSFTLGQLRFIDSFQFLPSSLECLVNTLKEDGLEAFPHVISEFSKREHVDMVVRKGVYPYDYMDSFEKFDEQKLPPIEEFYSSVKQEHVSEDEYTHAQEVFRAFNMHSLGDYHDLYLKTDVLLLTDVFESFRKMCMNDYELDACQYMTSPGLSWASLLKMTNVELDLITDIDQLLLIEAGIRGGISQISKRYDKANNPYLEDFEPQKPTRYLQYLDANNLYGWAMVQPLPTGEFRFLEDIEHFDVMSVPADAEKGYILQVSLHYPTSLHDHHNCLPLAPEQRTIENEQLSPYAQHLLRKLYGLSEKDPLPSRGTCSKLLTTLLDKDFYVVHYRNLQLYLALGMKVKTIHKILEFRQSTWMKPYIDFNTQKRKEATSAFTKDFYKLMNVSVFGKTMENLRKHRSIELVHREDRMLKLTAKPTYKTTTIFNEDLVAVELLRSKVRLTKPSYSGMCILDLSKHLMYEFWYYYIKAKYPSAELLMTDTDSLLFACNTDDIYEDMKSAMDRFDTSDYPKDHPLHSERNKKCLGLFKDETNGSPISEFVGLRAKMYSFVCNGKERKRAKGVSKVTVQKTLKHAHYKGTLFDETKKVSSMTVIRSHTHQLFCETTSKTGLSAFDDKRYLNNSIESFAYGHHKVCCLTTDKNIDRSTEPRREKDEVFHVVNGETYKTVKEKSFFIVGCLVLPCVKQ